MVWLSGLRAQTRWCGVKMVWLNSDNVDQLGNKITIGISNQLKNKAINKTALTLFGFWGDPHQSIFGYADKYSYKPENRR
jgi:hypothetical protein